MYTMWTQHLKDPESKNRFEQHISSSKEVLDRLRIIIENEVDGALTHERSKSVFENPNWAYNQAHTNGYIEALAYIHKLVDLDNQKVDK